MRRLRSVRTCWQSAGMPGVLIASGLGQRQARLEGLGGDPGIAEPFERQGTGQRRAVIHVMQGQQVRCFIARTR